MKIILVNTPTPILIIFHLELNLTVSSIRRWSTGLTKRELPIQWTVRAEVYAREARKTLSIYYWLAGGSVAYNYSGSCLK